MKFFQQRNFYLGRTKISLYQTAGRSEIGIGVDCNMNPKLFFLIILFWSIEISVLSKAHYLEEMNRKEWLNDPENKEEINEMPW